MTAVGIGDAISYGFRLMGYFLAVGFVGLVVAGIGAGIASTGAPAVDGTGGNEGVVAVGVLVAFVGLAVVYAGLLGVGYKVVADAVEKGLNAAQ